MRKSLVGRKKIILAIVAIIVLLLLAFWSFHTHSAEEKIIETIPTVKTILTKKGNGEQSIEVSGFARGENHADITPLASGKILTISKKEGDTVARGEIIATIYADQIDAQISANNSNILALEKTLKDSKKYYDQLVSEAKSADDNTNSDASKEALKSAKRARDLQIQTMEDQLVLAKGALGIAQVGKHNFSVMAPFAGKILNIYGRVGGFASFGSPLFSLSSDNNLEIETYVSASIGRQIKVGNAATFFAENNIPIIGTVSAVSAGADIQNLKTFVRISLDNSLKLFNLGDFLYGEISTVSEQKNIAIPVSAIVLRGGDTIVFIVTENNVVKEQPVKLGTIRNGLVDVNEGLLENQNIVIEGQQYLTNNLTVKIYATK